ncbi:hypothetical protein CS0771_30930 [Catellatospora sp. IY07-71]|nr:hypothetical protein CS0771_30930 [Catellatospora sp. IY07-71]
MPAMTVYQVARREALLFLVIGVTAVACNVTAAMVSARWHWPAAVLAFGWLPIASILSGARTAPGCAGFTVGYGGFTTGAARSRVSPVGWLAMGQVALAGTVRSSHVHVQITTLVLLVTGIALVTLRIWRGFPRLELRPEGIVRRTPWRTFIPWDALEAGPQLWVNGRRLTVRLAEPEFVEPLPAHDHLSLGAWDVPDDRLAHAIGWYAEHVDDRSAIGTPAELDRLTLRYDAAAYGLDAEASTRG